MTTVKPKHQSASSHRHPLAVFIVSSVLVHVAGLLMLMLLERSPTAKQRETEFTPIEFVNVPPETATPEPPEATQRQAAKNSVARGKVEPDKPVAIDSPDRTASAETVTPPQIPATPTIPQPATPPQTPSQAPEVKPTPPKLTPNKAKPPTTPPPPKATEPQLTAKDTTENLEPPAPEPPLEATPNPQTETTTSIAPSNPAPPSSASSGAASLLGGSYERSFKADAGETFFNPQATASRAADNPQGLNARQNVDLGPYLEEIRRRVRRNWNPSVSPDERHTVLTFSIQKNGQITGLKVARTSGSEVVDRESLAAVQRSAPFGALPASYPANTLDIEFNFNIYIYR